MKESDLKYLGRQDRGENCYFCPGAFECVYCPRWVMLHLVLGGVVHAADALCSSRSYCLLRLWGILLFSMSQLAKAMEKRRVKARIWL
jgi:hypothetical protein